MGYFSAGRQEKGRDASGLGTLELKTSRLQTQGTRQDFLIAVNGKGIDTGLSKPAANSPTSDQVVTVTGFIAQQNHSPAVKPAYIRQPAGSNAATAVQSTAKYSPGPRGQRQSR